MVEKRPQWPATPPITNAVGSCTATKMLPQHSFNLFEERKKPHELSKIDKYTIECICTSRLYLYMYSYIYKYSWCTKNWPSPHNMRLRCFRSISVGTTLGSNRVVSIGRNDVCRIPSCQPARLDPKSLAVLTVYLTTWYKLLHRSVKRKNHVHQSTCLF